MPASSRARASTPAAKHWGRKHRCAECGTAFYDMERTPIVCPKCGTEYVPTVALPSDGRRPRKNREWSAAPVAKPTPGVEEAAAEEEVEEIEAEAEGEAEVEEDEGAVPTLETEEEAIDPSDDDAIKKAER